MSNIQLSNVDDVLRALRVERGDIEKKEKVREEEYKRATKLYIKALQKETEAFERNRPNYDKRNESFKEEMVGIRERFKVGAFGLLKSSDRLHKEVDRLNSHLLEHYPKLASQVKDNLQREKEELELKLRRMREDNERNQIPVSQARIPSVTVMDIRQKRHELEKDHDTPYFSNVNPRNFQSQKHSPPRNGSYLDEFVSKPNPVDLPREELSRRSPYNPDKHAPAPIDFVYSQHHAQPRSRTPPYNDDRERGPRRNSKSPAGRTDMLSEFMYKLPNTVFSPPQDEINQRKQSPAKSESLLYSPFTGGDNESRFSRLSSVKKSQNF